MKTVLLFALFFISCFACAQQPAGKTDTVPIVKKKNIFNRLAGNFSTSDTADIEKAVIINPYFIYAGKTIRSVKIVRLGFERDINDTTKYNNNFGTIVANGFHKKTKPNVIANHLFFDTGDKVNPLLMADNERYLRDQPFIQDALITMQRADTGNAVDVTVIVKDVFSLGGSANLSSSSRLALELKEENFRGTGSRLAISTLYDAERSPRMGFGIAFLKRNIKGSFVNWETGFKSFNNAFNSDRREESTFYTDFERPFINLYKPWLGGLQLSLNKTKNNYLADSLYQRVFRYRYHKADGWIGYIFASRPRSPKKRYTQPLNYFIAARGIYQHFDELPSKVLDTFDYRYTNISGGLGTFSIFTQSFRRTNFIYGFGRNEDVPEGFRVSLTGGWINKKDSLYDNFRKRPYYAFEGQRSHFNTKGFFSNYTVRIGGYRYRGKWEDADVLFDVTHFTRRKTLNSLWYYRQFYSINFAKQIKTTLNEPLVLNSEFGLPFFANGGIAADMRCTAKTEAVFYNLHKFWGFRMAPFISGGVSLAKQLNAALGKSDIYTAIGGGIRTRNESLVFGTIELKAFYFPRVVAGMNSFRIDLVSNLRFTYNDLLIRKPDFIVAN